MCFDHAHEPTSIHPTSLSTKLCKLKKKKTRKTNLCYPKCSQMCDLLDCSLLTRASLLEKTDFPFSNANEGQLVHGWGRTVLPALIPMLGFGLAWPCTIITHAVMSLYVCFQLL